MAGFQSFLLNNYSLKLVCEREKTQRVRKTERGRAKAREAALGLLTQQVLLARRGYQGRRWVPGPAPGRVPRCTQAPRSASCFPVFWGHAAVGGAQAQGARLGSPAPRDSPQADVLHNCLHISPLWAHKTPRPVFLLCFVLLSNSLTYFNK